MINLSILNYLLCLLRQILISIGCFNYQKLVDITTYGTYRLVRELFQFGDSLHSSSTNASKFIKLKFVCQVGFK